MVGSSEWGREGVEVFLLGVHGSTNPVLSPEKKGRVSGVGR